jgi:hypothetical protein
MPLKHFTETLLILVLGVAMVVTGILVSTLPLLPEGLLPALILLGITLLYPIALYPLFRSNRADYPFRVLHFIPAFIVGGWLLLQGIAYFLPGLQFLTTGYVWGWTLAPVLIGFFLLMLFCLSVLRRWVARLVLLSVLLLLFVATGIGSSMSWRLDRSLASVLWQGNWWNITGTGSARFPGGYVALNPSSQPSSDPTEQEWRDKLNGYEARSSSIAAQSSSSVAGIWIGPVTTGSSSSAASVMVSSAQSASVSSLPSTQSPTTPKPGTPLPSSGFATEVLPFVLLAGYGTVLQRRAKKRAV